MTADVLDLSKEDIIEEVYEKIFEKKLFLKDENICGLEVEDFQYQDKHYYGIIRANRNDPNKHVIYQNYFTKEKFNLQNESIIFIFKILEKISDY